MEPWLIGVIIKPLVAFGFFFAAALIARAIMKRVKSERWRKILLRHVGP
jgi:hypothetical protein